MRYYFHLVNCIERIPDMEGVEAASLAHAQEQALKAIEELRHEGEDAAENWAGWKLEFIDGAGRLIMFLDLGKSLS